jgi:ParB family chromosome partitioning protein
LGRGLEALLGPGPAEEVREIPLTDIEPSPYQARGRMDPGRMEELVASIREHGLLQPVLVRPKGERYELVAGERRWRAAREAGLEKIPALVRTLDDRQALEIGLVENLQREDLNPLEEARAYRRMMEELGYTQEEVARRVGKSRAAVANALRLLALEEEIQRWIEEGKLTAGHARALLAVKGTRRLALARRWVKEATSGRPLSVREAEAMARQAQARREDWVSALERELEDHLGTKIRLRWDRRGGRLELFFSDSRQLEDFFRLITGRTFTLDL